MKRVSRGYDVHCPAHPDRNPSLNVCEGHDGRILLTYRAGCSFETIIAALGVAPRDLFAVPPRNGNGDGQQRLSTLVAEYIYGSGDRRYANVRLAAPKGFRIKRWDPARNDWIWYRCGHSDREPGRGRPRGHTRYCRSHGRPGRVYEVTLTPGSVVRRRTWQRWNR